MTALKWLCCLRFCCVDILSHRTRSTTTVADMTCYPHSVDTYWRPGLKSVWNQPAILSTYQCRSGEKFRLWLYYTAAVALLLFSEKKLYVRNQQRILLVYITANTSNALRSSMFVVYERKYYLKKKMFFLGRRESSYTVHNPFVIVE